jgi:hypothetical protein
MDDAGRVTMPCRTCIVAAFDELARKRREVMLRTLKANRTGRRVG